MPYNFPLPDELFLNPVYDPHYALSMYRNGSEPSNGSSTSSGVYYPSDPTSPYPETTYYQQLQPTGGYPQCDGHSNSYSSEPISSTFIGSVASSTRHHRSISSASTRSASERYYCDYSDCFKNGRRSSFSRRADLTRHYQSVHSNVLHNCPWRKCDRKGPQGFGRIDHLIEHRRAFHNEPIPKRENSARESSR